MYYDRWIKQVPGNQHWFAVYASHIIVYMKTIAISIDEDTLDRVDRLAKSSNQAGKNRSHVIRLAIREYVSRLERQAEEEREAAILRRHRGSLARQAKALVREQAKP